MARDLSKYAPSGNLHERMERVLDEISFDATDKGGETILIDAAYVQARIGDLAKNADLSKFIL
jgi:ATP-dependent HslUV protease ATP-binding subunit HslU